MTRERRQITVSFCDLVDYTALSHRVDPEEISEEVLGPYRRSCGAAIEALGGHVARYFGDGIMAYFGWPRADEHDAERAIRAGLASIDAMAALSRDSGHPLSARVGIATGLVVIGGEPEPSGDGGIAGEAPNLADRLQKEAMPNTMVVDSATARLAGDAFVYESLGRRAIKGLAEPIELFRVLGPAPRESRFDARHGTVTTPFIGREDEIALMTQRWSEAAAGSGKLMLVSGDAGMGKSRLVHELRERSNAGSVLRYQCSPLYTDTALFPFAQQIERAAAIASNDSLGEKLVKLRQALQQTGVDIDEHLPFVCALLSLGPAAPRPPDLTPQQLRDRLVDCLRTEMQGRCRPGPVLVIFEDVQWIDPTSESLLLGLLRDLPQLPMAVVVTGRDSFTTSWYFSGYTTLVHLDGLRDDASRRLVAALADGRIAEATERQIVSRAEGIPLFLEELTRHVLHSVQRGERDQLGKIAEDIPTTLQRLLTMRLDRTGTAKRLAQIGAVLGRRFALRELEELAGLPTDYFYRQIDALLTSGLLQQRGRDDDAALAFKHALVRDAAYAGLLNSEKRRLHCAALEQLERHGNAPPALLAFHAEKGEKWDKAVEYLFKASALARRASANREVLALYERALEALGHLPVEATAALAIALRIHAFSSLMALGEFDRLVRAVEEADELARRYGDKRQQAAVKGQLAGARWLAGQHRAGLTPAEDAERLAHELGDFALLLSARFARANLSHALGNIREAVELYEAMLADLTGEFEFKRFGWHGIASGLTRGHLAWSQVWLGDFDAAWRTIERAQDVVRDMPEPYSVVYAYMAEGLYHVARGEPAKAVAAFELAHRVNTESEMLLPIALAWLGGAYALGGRAEEAVTLLLSAEQDGSYKAGGKYCWIHHYLSLAQAYLALGEFAAARAALDNAREIAETAEEMVHIAWVLKTIGDVEAADPGGARDAAMRSYQGAMAIARPRRLLPLLAQCHAGLAETFRRSPEAETAALHQAEAERIFTAIGLPDWASRVMRVTPRRTAPKDQGAGTGSKRTT